jgi:hypothetical protein
MRSWLGSSSRVRGCREGLGDEHPYEVPAEIWGGDRPTLEGSVLYDYYSTYLLDIRRKTDVDFRARRTQ